MGAGNEEATESFLLAQEPKDLYFEKKCDVLKQTPFLPNLNLGIFLLSRVRWATGESASLGSCR